MSIVENVRSGMHNSGNVKGTPDLPAEEDGSGSFAAMSFASSEEQLLAMHGRTFHFAARFFPTTLRRPITTLYAFFRTLDDLVDEPGEQTQKEDIRKELHAWQLWFKAEGRHTAPREPLGARLAHVMAEYHIPSGVFLDFLAGLTLDLEPQEILTFAEMEVYCYGVAGTVGRALAHIMGATSEQALHAAESLGIAMQLTNILRDVGSDLSVGRIYLPREDLVQFGSSRAHLYQLWQQQSGPDARFRAIMRHQIARASNYYLQSMPGIWLLPLECRLPVLLAARLYRRILLVIERRDYDVLRSRAATSFSEKLSEAIITFILDRLWRGGEASAYAEVEVCCES